MLRLFLNKFNLKNYLPSIILMGMFLSPHGIGYRFPIGHIDAPRFFVLGVVTVWCVKSSRHFFKLNFFQKQPGVLLFIVLVSLTMSSAIFSSSPLDSSILAIQMCTLWYGFAIAYVSLFFEELRGQILNKTLVVIFSVLSVAALYEVVTQGYLFPDSVRTSFSGYNSYSPYRSGGILAQGPFMWNHGLSGFCAAGCGAAIFALDKAKKWGFLFAFVFVALLIASGTRAGFYGVAIAFLAYTVWSRKFVYFLHFCISSAVVNLAYLLFIGNHAPPFFSGDINSTWVNMVPSMTVISEKFKNTLLSPELTAFFSSLGPVGVKIMGFILNIFQLNEWWLNGYGFGSFQRPHLVSSSAIQYDDPGIIQLIFLESGLIAGFFVVFILVSATWIGLKSERTKYYSAGITAWSLFALSSWEVWPIPLIMIFVFEIFHARFVALTSTGEKLRSLR